MARTLEWIRDNYDVNNSHYIEDNEVTLAKNDYISKKIAIGDYLDVINANTHHTLLPAPTGNVSGVAKGKIVNFNYPASSTVGQRIAIRASVENIGYGSGTFKLQLFTGYTRVAQSTSFSVAMGQTSSSKSMYINTPSHGSSVAYQIKCVRIT